jgi:hypothetical protein
MVSFIPSGVYYLAAKRPSRVLQPTRYNAGPLQDCDNTLSADSTLYTFVEEHDEDVIARASWMLDNIRMIGKAS